MQSLFLFLYRFRAFIFFVLLEVVCAWLIVKNNRYQSAAFFNTADSYAARMLRTSNAVFEYIHLREVNEDLARENARLNGLFAQLQSRNDSIPVRGYQINPAVARRFQFRVAKVINSTTGQFNNHLTLDKGTLDGIKPDMGVISSQGVVGKVKYCSEHFSTVVSLLHQNMQVSSQIKKNSTIGTAKWDGTNPMEINLLYIPRHVELQKGDTVVTSSYNTIFPEGVMIGAIKDFSLAGDAAFYDIDLALSTDFYKLTYVYVVDNTLKAEQDSLEQRTIPTSN